MKNQKKDVKLTRQIHEKVAIHYKLYSDSANTSVWDSFFCKARDRGTINCLNVLREIIITSEIIVFH